MNLSQRIKEKAREIGFDLVGIAPAKRALHAEALAEYLDRGYQGSMEWLKQEPGRRADPRQLLEHARSLVVLGLSYYVQDPEPEIWNDPMRGRIARYAWGRDYHRVIQPMLKELAAFIVAESPDAQTRTYVDFGPVLEHDFASQAGLGFVGKNTLLIHPAYGSYCFLGEVLTTVELEPDEPATDDGATLNWQSPEGQEVQGTCGSCERCLHACPTHAFPAAYILDSRLCISYLTIELREAIPEALRPKMANWIFGCDDCQTVCPWVQKGSPADKGHWLSYDPGWVAPRLDELMYLDDRAFLERYAGTPVMRTKRRGLLRNAAVALGNSGLPEAIPALEHALQDPEPLVREHAQWGLDRLASGA
jgi:epoxyqueuosine reductase